MKYYDTETDNRLAAILAVHDKNLAHQSAHCIASLLEREEGATAAARKIEFIELLLDGAKQARLAEKLMLHKDMEFVPWAKQAMRKRLT